MRLAMEILDPWQWLEKDGSIPTHDPRMRKVALRVASFIEAGGPLPPLSARQTLVPCSRRPRGKACKGLLWVVKTDNDRILVHCLTCHHEEAVIDNWQGTYWAGGPMAPAPVTFADRRTLN